MSYPIQMPGWCRDFCEEVGLTPPFKIGDTVRHPSGRTVRIIGGQYWGTYGLSNHWTWCEVLADGTLGPEESGYGWDHTKAQ